MRKQTVWFNPGVARGTFYPLTHNLYDLGKATKRFRDLYLAGGVYMSNNTWISQRNQADSAWINMMRVDTANNTIVNAASGQNINFRINDNTAWLVGSGGWLQQDATYGSDICFQITAGTVRQSTSDGSDNKYIGIAGGGSLATSRGAQIFAGGNESVIPGQVILVGGAIATGHVILRLADVSGQIQVQNSSAANMWTVNNSGQISQDATNGGDVIINKTATAIRMGTSDGSDNKYLVLTGGGGFATNRGAYITLAGNEETSVGYRGEIVIAAGDGSGGSGGNIFLRAYGSSGKISFATGSSATEKWQINSSGQFVQDGTNGSDIVFNKSPSAIRHGTSDGSDNVRMIVAAGGAIDDTGRGAQLTLHGNEASGTGGASLALGNISTAHLTLQLNNASSEFRVAGTAGTLWKVTNGGALTQDGTNGGNIIMTKSASGIVIGTTTLQTGQLLRLYTAGSGATKPTNCLLELEAAGNTGANISNQAASASGYYFSNPSAAYDGGMEYDNNTRALSFRTAAASRWTINSSGALISSATSANIIIGASSAHADVYANQFFSVSNTTAGANNMFLLGNAANSTGAILTLGKTRSSSSDADTIVQSGDTLGTIQFVGADGAGYLTAAFVRAVSDATPGTNDMPTRLEFHTTIDGGLSPARKWYINNTGSLHQDSSNGGNIYFNRDAYGICQGTADASDNAGIFLNGGGGDGPTRGSGVRLWGNEKASNGGVLQFMGGGVSTGSIYFDLNHASASIIFRNSSTNTMWSINNSGTLTSDASNGGGIILAKTGGNLTPIISGTGSLDTDLTNVVSTHCGLVITQDTNAVGSQMSLVNYGTSALGVQLNAFKTRETTAGSTSANTVSVTADEILAIRAFASDGAAYVQSSQIQFSIEGTVASSQMPGIINFRTSTTNSVLTRWSINSSGQFSQDATNGGDILFNKNGSSIRGGWDGSAVSRNLSVYAGNSGTTSQGAILQLASTFGGGMCDLYPGVGGSIRLFGSSGTGYMGVSGTTTPVFSHVSPQGASRNIKLATQTLSGLSGASATTSGLIPAKTRLLGVVVRVTTAITGATTFKIGDGTDDDRFGAGIAIALNTTTSNADFTADPAGWNSAAKEVTLTANGSNFTAGAVRIVAYYEDMTGPTS